jgi:hypothetical protein
MPECKYPRNESEIFAVLGKLSAHASFCLSGDNTLPAISEAIKEALREEGDDYLCIILSDANLIQYNLSTSAIATVLNSEAKVSANIVFIGNLSDQAQRLKSDLPPGKAHICLDTAKLPQILKSIFTASLQK